MSLSPSHPLVRFQDAFAQVTPGMRIDLAPLYADNVRFVDPFHQLSGRDAVQTYFSRIAKRLTWGEFDFGKPVLSKGAAALPWTMRIKSRPYPKVFVIEGISHMRYDERITYHRDYFDLSAVIPDQIPGLGLVSRRAKAWV